MGKNGGKQHTPYEAPNDLTSRQKLSIIDLVSEGPIEGPVGDLKGVYLNNTPVIDSSGNSNVNGMTAQWVSGTLEQPALEGFSSSSSETPVSVEVKKSTPVTRTITSRNIDRLRLTFGTQALVEVKDNGDRVGTSVDLQIQIQRSGSWVTEKNVTIRGKRSNSPYLMAVVLDNLPPPPFSIRMVRLTADSTSDKLQNNTIWSSYTEITDITQTYPGSAVAGLTFESEQFGNQYPSRNYLVKGLIIQVPDNYDPETRTYKGIWSGSFKPAYTNNPAWVLYSLLTNERFGLGKRLKISEVDKFALYMIGQYCDQLVPNGFGDKEPRMTCNAYLTDIRKAYDYMSDLCSMMRIMPVWNGQQLTFVQDRPSDIVWPYTNANVVNGRFNYSFSPLKARHTIIEVRFIDPENGWKTSIEQVSDDALIAQFGPNVLRVDAFGCTSRGQARRHGLWILLTEKLETQTVEFDVGAEGLRHTPGDIIEVMDNDWVGEQIGGRLLQVDTVQKILTLDRDIESTKTGITMISVINGAGKPERVKAVSYPSSNQVKVESLPNGVRHGTVWALGQSALARRLFRAITITDKGDGSYGVIAVQHVPEKESIVDHGVTFEPLPDTPLGGYIPPVENLSVEVSPDNDSWQVEANWTTTTAVRGVDFILKLTQAGRIVGTAKTQENRYRIGNLPQGNYLLSVSPQNKDGQKGDQSTVSFDINPPPPPSHIEVNPGFFSLGVIPYVGGQNALRLQYEFWFSVKRIANINDVEQLAEYLGNGTMWVIQGRNLKAGQIYYVYVRSVNPVGKSQFVEASGAPETKTDEIIEMLDNEFMTTEAGKQLDKKLEWLNESALINSAAMYELQQDLFTKHGQSQAQIKELWRVYADSEQAWAEKYTTVNASINGVQTEVKKLDQAIAKLDSAFSQSITEVTASINKIDKSLGETNQSVAEIEAGVVKQDKAIAELNKSFAESQAQVQVKFGKQEALINTKMQAEFEQGAGYAMHSTNITIVVDGKKYNAAGMVISAELKNGKIESFIGFNANNFAFYNPSSGKMEAFVYMKNSQMYVRDIFIEDGAITNAKIGNVIQSKKFESGVSGWKIDKNGDAEFNSAVFRGLIDGADGHFSGTIDAKEILGDVYFATNKKISGTPLNKVFAAGALDTGWVKAIEISSDNFERVFDAGLMCTFETSRASNGINYSTYEFSVGVDDGLGGIEVLDKRTDREDVNNGLTVSLTVNDIPVAATGRGNSLFVYLRARTTIVSSNTTRNVRLSFLNTKRAEIFKDGKTLIKPLNQ